MKKTISSLILLFIFYTISPYAANKINLYTSCENGDKENCSKIGKMYIQQDSSIEDTLKQFSVLSNACNDGDASACMYLGAI